MLQQEHIAVVVNGNLKKSKPRIALSISPELYTALEELADLSGQPNSKFPAHILEESLPVILKIVESFKAAKTNKQKAKNIMDETLEKTIISSVELLVK